MNNPLISVILPTYNHASVIENAIKSVTTQTYPHYELIINDDASNDNTLDVVGPYLGDRTRYYRNPTNLGLYESWNRAFLLTRGDFLCTLDADDFLPADSLEKRITFLMNNLGTDIVLTGLNKIDQLTGSIQYVQTVDVGNINSVIDFLTLDIFPPTLGINSITSLAKKELFVDIGARDWTKYESHSDFELILRTIERTNVGSLPISTYNYNIHPDSMNNFNKDDSRQQLILTNLKSEYLTKLRALKWENGI